MKVKVSIESRELSKEELRALLQAVRSCEMESFRDKEIFIWVEVPELSEAETIEIFASIKPPYRFGPFIHRQGNSS